MMYTMMPYRSCRIPQRHCIPAMPDDFFFHPFIGMNERNPWGFRVDIHEEPDHYGLEAVLPGLERDQISVTVEKDALNIAADLRRERKEENPCHSEHRKGRVSRTFSLDGIDQEKITAKYRNGILYVNLPKQQPAEDNGIRRIDIADGSEAQAEV